MIVKFSRHAKRRAKLCKIPESTVEKILADSDLTDGDHELIRIDTTTDGKLIGIEILKASKKINIDTILSYTLELDQSILRRNISEQE